jgi:Sulfotransferase family
MPSERQSRPSTLGPPRALFVLGAPRSGTTLIGNYLGSAPRVTNLAEYGGFYVAHSIVPSVITRLPGFEHEDYLAEVKQHALAFAEGVAAAHGSSWYCDSTPWNLEIAAELARVLPDALFVLMLRHYSGTILSLRPLPWAGDSWEGVARLWAEINSRTAALPEDRLITVGYEALVEEPERTLPLLLAAAESHGFDTAELDARMLTLSHAAVVGRPRPTIGVIDGDMVRLQPIPSLDTERWSGDIHQRVWPLVKDMHHELLRRFPGVYRCPPAPAMRVHDDVGGLLPYEPEGW